jgi:predicted transcriptional regulator
MRHHGTAKRPRLQAAENVRCQVQNVRAAPCTHSLTGYVESLRLLFMEVRLTPDQEAELSKLATRKGRDAQELAQEVIGFYLEHEARFIEAVKRGMDSLDRGEYVSHEDVGARIERLLRP